MEKRVLLAALLSSLFLAWYAQTLPRTRPANISPQVSSETNLVGSPAQSDVVLSAHLYATESVVTIESDQLLLEIGSQTASIRRATLKKFMNEEKTGPFLMMAVDDAQFSCAINGWRFGWHVIDRTATSVTLESDGPRKGQHRIKYSLDGNQPIVNFSATTSASDLSQPIPTLEVSSTLSNGSLFSKTRHLLQAVALRVNDNGKPQYKRFHPVPVGKPPKNVPRGTKCLTISEQYFCQSVMFKDKPGETRIVPTHDGAISASTALEFIPQNGALAYSGEIYFGPVDYFSMKQSGFESALPIGTIGKIGLILLMVLSWAGAATGNYGIGIIALSGVITLCTAPFTVMSFKSMKKMQELKPEVDRIMAKSKDDPKKANQEVFQLYRTHKVSPLSSCLPMLLQMPVFIALFQGLSHFVKLRGESFLWIADLSMPDRLAKFPISLPLLGSHLNILPIVMAAAMFFQSKMSQPAGQVKDPSNPTAMLSGPLMSVMFGVMFYQFPSGLVLYWLTNSLLTMVWYRLAK